MVRRVVHWTNGEEEESQKNWREKTQRKGSKQATAEQITGLHHISKTCFI